MGGVEHLVVQRLIVGHLQAIVAVRTHHITIVADGTGLRDDVRTGNGVIVRSVQELGASGLDLLQLGGVLGVIGAGGILLCHNLKAGLLGGIGESLAHAGGVRVAGAVQHGDLLDLQGLGCELGRDLTLIGILEAGAEHVATGLDGVGGGGRSDGRQLGLVGQRSHCRGGGGDGRTEHAEHAVVAGELVEGVRGFGGVALIVHGLELDLLAVDTALGVDLVHCQLEAGDLGLAVCGGGAGVGGDGSQRDGIAVGRATIGAAGIVHAAAGAGSEGH